MTTRTSTDETRQTELASHESNGIHAAARGLEFGSRRLEPEVLADAA